MTTPAQLTAAQMYAARRADIALLLEVLDIELQKQDDQFKADPTNWGRTGDLREVRTNLVKTVCFLRNEDSDGIERFLEAAAD